MQAANELIAAVNNHIAETRISEVIESEALSEQLIPKIKRTSRGTEFYYGYGRSKIMAIAIMFLGLFLGGFSYFFFDGFIDFLSTTALVVNVYVTFFSAGIFLLGLFLIINNLTIEVSLAGIAKQQKILGFKLDKFIKTENIADILVEQGVSSSSGNSTRVWYALKLYTHDGDKIEVADSLEGHSYAVKIRQEMLNALGSHWQESAIDKSKKKAKKSLPRWARWSGKLLSYSFTMALLYDLSQFFPEVTELFSQIKF